MTELQRVAAIKRLEQMEDCLPPESFDKKVLQWAKEDMMENVRKSIKRNKTLPKRQCKVCGENLDLKVAILGLCTKCSELLEV